MLDTTAEIETLKNFNLGNLPPPDSQWCGKFFNMLWEDARKEKIGRLGLHQRWIDLHAAYRGKRRKQKYPRVGGNYLFKTVEAYCAILTEKVPIAEFTADDADDPMLIKAFDHEAQEWWLETEQQASLHSSAKNMQIYGTTVEKGVLNLKTLEGDIVLLDPFNCFPAPGFTMCDMNIPYFCEVGFFEAWEIKAKFGLPDEIIIPADANEQIAGKERETTRGGKTTTESGRHYASNYAPVEGDASTEALKNKTMVVEVWVRDNSTDKIPVTVPQDIPDEYGQPSGQVQEVSTGEVNEVPRYLDGIRKITICPALIGDFRVNGILDDSPNPNINWGLLDLRVQSLVENGISQPVMDETGNPVVDPATGQPAVQMVPIPEPEARQMIYDRAKTCFYLWDRFPYSVVPSRVDTSQWWGFSILEQLEELQGKAEVMLTKYLLALERQMYPIFNNVLSSGVEDNQVTNEPGIVIRSTIAAAPFMGFIESPQPPSEYLEALQFVLFEMDVVSMSPEASEGRRPKGISAASAIIALQDKAATLSSPQVRQVDKITRNRGRIWGHFKMNFDTTKKQVKIDDQIIEFKGTDVFSNFKFNVESGSSAPITKAGQRQQFVELRKMGDMDRLSLLERLDIPQAKLINERLTEQESVPGAINILMQAGLPQEVAQQIYFMVMQQQFGPKKTGGTSMPTAEDKARQGAGGYSEGMTNANNQMVELREG